MDTVPFKYRFASRTMYARIQFLNQAVCDTMTAAVAAPMTSVRTMTSA